MVISAVVPVPNFRCSWTRDGHDYLLRHRDGQFTLSTDGGAAVDLPYEEGIRLHRQAFTLSMWQHNRDYVEES